MRFRLFIIFFFAIAFLVPHYMVAQEVTVVRSALVEKYKGKPYYIHFVAQGETLAAIAKAYFVTSKEIADENPEIEKGLKADMVLRIPKRAETEIIPVEKPGIAKPKEQVGDTKQKNNDSTSVPNIIVDAAMKQEPAISTSQPEPIVEAKQKQPVVSPKQKESTGIEKQKEPVKDVKTSEVADTKGDYIQYMVRKQETLYAISKKFNITVDEILKANPGLELLKEGMTLKIPFLNNAKKEVVVTEPVTEKTTKSDSYPDEIVVKSGETLYSIGKTYNINVDNLIDWNPQLNEGLKAGMVLNLRKPDPKKENKSVPKASNTTEVKPVQTGVCFDEKNSKATYQVALLLPLLLDDADEVLESPEQKNPASIENFEYFQFYAGFMLAADSLEHYGLHARIQVMDAERLSDTLVIRQTMRKQSMDKMDLLVGPLYASSFTIASRYAKKNEIGIVNPLSRREGIVDGNPFVIKTQVSSSAVASKLVSFISENYPDANVISVRNDMKEHKSMADDFESQLKKGVANQSFKGTVQNVVYSAEHIAGVVKKLKRGEKNIVVLFSNNKIVVPNFISLLNPSSKSNDIILVGMDGWEDITLESEYLVNLNFHQITSSYIDYGSEAVQQFVSRFRNKYGAIPQVSKHAFLGYDIGWYFLTSLMQYGKGYMNCIPDYKISGLQYDFNFTSSKSGSGLQNRNISLVKLIDYKMVKLK